MMNLFWREKPCAYISLMDEMAEMIPLPMMHFSVVPLVLLSATLPTSSLDLTDPIPCSHVQDLDTSIKIPNTLRPISFSSLHPTNYPILGDHPSLPLIVHNL